MTIPPWQFQKAHTPELIKRILVITTIVTLVCVALDPWLNLQHLLALTPLAYSSLYIWQPLTSLFLLPSPTFSFGFLIDFAFAMLIFWLFGSLVLERIGKKQFLIVYFASALLSGLAALTAMHYFQYFTALSAFFPMLLAVTTLWTMTDPMQEILLFFVLPLKAKWVLVFALIGTLFVSFVHQDIISFTAYFTAFAFSYIYGIVALGFRSPFDWMQGAEKVLKTLSFHTRRFWQWYILATLRKGQEILKRYAARRKMREDTFVDTALTKISKGEQPRYPCINGYGCDGFPSKSEFSAKE